MDEKCPVCQQPLQRQDNAFYCASCQGRFQQQALCPDCDKPLEVLIACGAVDYFCPHGDGMISKKRVVPRYVPLP